MTALADAAAARVPGALDLLGRLVAEPSLEGSEAIERCLDLVEGAIRPYATDLERPAHDGLTSLVARFGPPAERRALAFSGHVDVVPAEGRWTTAPFALARGGGRLRGRGVCDMKGAVAAFVAVIGALHDAGLLDRCSLELVLTGDEEVGSRRGLLPLLDAGAVTATSAICGEPTGLDVFLGNRGLIWIDVAIRGRGGHAGLAHALANPIEPATALAAGLARLPLDARDDRFDPPAPSLTVTRIAATAGAVNIVPDEATLSVDRRLVPGEDVVTARREILDLIDRVVADPFAADVSVLREWPPYAIGAGEPVALEAREAVRAAGRPAALGMDLAANDSSWLHRAGVTTVLLGPGAPEQAHTTDEELDEAELAGAVAIYADVAAAMAVR